MVRRDMLDTNEALRLGYQKDTGAQESVEKKAVLAQQKSVLINFGWI
jgi:hypothetical protein